MFQIHMQNICNVTKLYVMSAKGIISQFVPGSGGVEKRHGGFVVVRCGEVT